MCLPTFPRICRQKFYFAKVVPVLGKEAVPPCLSPAPARFSHFYLLRTNFYHYLRAWNRLRPRKQDRFQLPALSTFSQQTLGDISTHQYLRLVCLRSRTVFVFEWHSITSNKFNCGHLRWRHYNNRKCAFLGSMLDDPTFKFRSWCGSEMGFLQQNVHQQEKNEVPFSARKAHSC